MIDPRNMSLDQLMTAMRQGGAFDQAMRETPGLREMGDQDLETAQQIARVFASEDGKAVLAWLQKYTIGRPTWHPLGLDADPAKVAAFGMFREGQNSIFYQVVSMLEFAERGAKGGGAKT